MANSERIIRNYVKSEKRKGTADAKIIVGITKLDGQAGKDATKMVRALQDAGLSPTQELGAYFGLSTKPVDPKATKKNKNATLGDKAKSTNYSAMTGVAKSFGTVAQVANSGLDAVSGGINKALGTKIPTGNRAAYDRDVAAMDARKNQLRDQANYSGMDLGELTGDIAAKAPLYVAGGAPSAACRSARHQPTIPHESAHPKPLFAGYRYRAGAGRAAPRTSPPSGARSAAAHSARSTRHAPGRPGPRG